MSDPCICSWGAPHGDPCLSRIETQRIRAIQKAFRTLDSPKAKLYFMGMQRGAAIAFGLVGMFEAIRKNYDHLRACGFHSPPYCGGPCMRCGYDDGMRRSADGETWSRVDLDRSNEHE